jgi:spore germination protein GerM
VRPASVARLGYRRGSAVLGAVAFAIAIGACGIPTDSSPRDVPRQYVLDPDASTDVSAAVPSISGPRAYFLSGSPGEQGTLLPVSRQVSSTGTDVVQALFDGLTPAEQSGGLRTAIPEGTELLDARLLPDGTVRVDLNEAIFDANGRAQTEAVAQIVFTATGTAANKVELLVDGERRAWLLGDGSLEEGPLTRFMFPALNPSTRPDYPPLPAGGLPVASTTTTTSPLR